MRKKFLHWSKTPVIVPRWMLFAKYVGFMILGVLSLIAGGLNTLNIVTFEGYTVVWSLGVIALGAVSAIGSLREKWECHVEKWASLMLFSLLATWAVAATILAFNEGDLNRATGAFAILLLSLLPGVRAFSLLALWGIK